MNLFLLPSEKESGVIAAWKQVFHFVGRSAPVVNGSGWVDADG